VPDVPFKTRDDYSDHRDAELRASQVDRDDPGDPDPAQVCELPVQVSNQIISGKAWNPAEQMGPALLV